jgi:hypothetical protein
MEVLTRRHIAAGMLKHILLCIGKDDLARMYLKQRLNDPFVEEQLRHSDKALAEKHWISRKIQHLCLLRSRLSTTSRNHFPCWRSMELCTRSALDKHKLLSKKQL